MSPRSASLRSAAVVLVLTLHLGGCASLQQRPGSGDPDLAWVCGQHDLITDFRGRITFEDVQRTLCYFGRYTGRLDLQGLERGALAEAQRCGGETTVAGLNASRSPSTIRELYGDLKAASGTDESSGCAATAMIRGMVRILGDEYGFHPRGEPEPERTADGPTATLLNKAIVYVKFSRFLSGGQQVVEQALREGRSDHTISGLMLDLRGADGAPIDELARFIDLFLDDGIVLKWRERFSGRLSTIDATRRPPAEMLPLVILVDAKTQSGAEAFAGVLRARGRALLIGQRTLGRAFVQTVLDLPSASRLVVPIGDLLEPGGGMISGKGVEPDVEFGSTFTDRSAVPGDTTILLAVQVISATRSAARADLLDAVHQVISARRPAPD